MPTNTLHCFTGTFTLERRPRTPDQPLQAWDATDEYLLESLSTLPAGPKQILLINDSFGALGVALNEFRPYSWGDSFTARLALQDNLERNQLSDLVTFIPATSDLPGDVYDVVLWRIPKSVAFWQEQLIGLVPFIRENTLLLFCGGMIKHLPPNTKEVLQQLGTVDVLPAQKKARLFRVTPQPGQPLPVLPTSRAVMVPEFGLRLVSGSNVFAAEKLDSGAKAFINQFPHLPKAERIADLGCGNGILGLVARRLQPDAEITFLDESCQAVASAESNYIGNGFADSGPPAHFLLDDCLSHYSGEPFALILCNPPFHQAHAIGDQIAWQMFVQSRRHLRPGGELWIVGNRHLNYHIKLKRVFGNCRQIGSHPQFVVLAARR